MLQLKSFELVANITTIALSLVREERCPVEDDDESISDLSSECEPESEGYQDSSNISVARINSLRIQLESNTRENLSTTTVNDILGGQGTSADDKPDATEPEMVQIHSAMKDIVQHLYKMSMVIRQPIPMDKIAKAAGIPVGHYETFDCNHVRDCYPMAASQLQSRLASAITCRRQYLIYRERHHQALSRPARPNKDSEFSELFVKIAPTARSGLFIKNLDRKSIGTREGTEIMTQSGSQKPSTKATTFVPPDIKMPVLEPDYTSEADMQSNYSSTYSSRDETVIPPCPVDLTASDTLPFECPFCFFIVKIKNVRRWR
jgi:hypothetical protein